VIRAYIETLSSALLSAALTLTEPKADNVASANVESKEGTVPPCELLMDDRETLSNKPARLPLIDALASKDKEAFSNKPDNVLTTGTLPSDTKEALSSALTKLPFTCIAPVEVILTSLKEATIPPDTFTDPRTPA
jgi:hypothetical protein